MPNTIKILPKHIIQQLNTYFKDDQRSSIEKLGSLTHLITFSKLDTQLLYFDAETLQELKSIYYHNPESLLLYFASKGDPNWIKIAVPVNYQLDLVTSLATTTDYNAWQETYLHHKDSDMNFDLTYIDAYQGYDTEHDDDTVRFVKSYLKIYGDPHSEDWSASQRTYFADVYTVVDNCDEWERKPNMRLYLSAQSKFNLGYTPDWIQITIPNPELLTIRFR